LLALSKAQFIDVQDLNYLAGKSAFQIIESLIARKRKLTICPNVDSRDMFSNTVSHQLSGIYRTAKGIFEECGAKDLYVGYPFVQGKMIDGTPIRCPLIFFPVELENENNEWVLRLRDDAEVSWNKTFMLAYSHFNNTIFDENFLEQDFTEAPTDSQEFRTALYHLLKNSPLELNFNTQIFEDRIDVFKNWRKTDFQTQIRTGELTLLQEAVIGIFPQADSYLMPDYDTLLRNENLEDLQDFFVHNLPDTEKSTAHTYIREEELMTPYQIDASQERAVCQIKMGHSLVIQGPPGSGKSQLICNLIADYMARGKNILLVCQKRAALDVVYQRLQEKGLANFAGLVHDFKNDRKTIYDQISKQIDNIENYKTQNNSLDAIHIERNFITNAREIEEITEELDSFRTALFDVQACGIAVKELYLTSNPNREAIRLNTVYQYFRFNDLPDSPTSYHRFLPKLKIILKYAAQFQQPDFIWKDRLNFADWGLSQLQNIKETIQQILPYNKSVIDFTESHIKNKLDIASFIEIQQQKEDYLQLLGILNNPQIYRYFCKALTHHETEILWLTNRKKVLLSCYETVGIEETLAQEDISIFQAKLQRAIRKNKNWFTRLLWRVKDKDRPAVLSVLQKNNLQPNNESYEILMQRLNNRLNLHHNITKLIEVDWLDEIPMSLLKDDYIHWFEAWEKAIEAKKIYLQLSKKNNIFGNHITLSFKEFTHILLQILAKADEVQTTYKGWSKYLSVKQINGILDHSLSATNLLQSISQYFDALCEYDKLKQNLTAPEATVLDILRYDDCPVLNTNENLQTWIDQKTALFDNSLRLAWIEHIEEQYPVLRIVSSGRIQQLESRLQQAIKEKQEAAAHIVAIRTKERTYKGVAYNRLNNMVTYRELNHQVNKKRNIWALRKLFQTFSREILDLVPCWMASPESVSAVFPLEQFFDLVIFDEASQCFAEKGIPAMYRGKQVLITGDDQQLAPFDLYTPRWEEAQDDSPALEVVSLLDLAKQYLPEVMLTGHYRSQSLDLIDFSNRTFYNNKLRMLPHFEEFRKSEPAIKYILTDGVYDNGINEIEAEKVVALLQQLFEQGKKNVGVITFNFKQRELIMDTLEAKRINLPETVFIKNIENVQGDERDIIIFSIGYAPNASGKMFMQFGLLNQLKGENRLNVAVTRAKEKIYIVSSITPSQLEVENTKNEGTKILKSYLQYAWDVSEGNYKPTILKDNNYRLSWYLSQKIQQDFKEWTVLTTDLPFSDLSSDKRHLILTDDAIFHQSISAKEAHAYLPLMLQDKQWIFARFYSRNYWKDNHSFQEDFARLLAKPTE
jgi:hypothetical protein